VRVIDSISEHSSHKHFECKAERPSLTLGKEMQPYDLLPCKSCTSNTSSFAVMRGMQETFAT